MKPGDYIEILQSNQALGPQTLRGIILEVDAEIGLWPACRIVGQRVAHLRHIPEL